MEFGKKIAKQYDNIKSTEDQTQKHTQSQTSKEDYINLEDETREENASQIS